MCDPGWSVMCYDTEVQHNVHGYLVRIHTATCIILECCTMSAGHKIPYSIDYRYKYSQPYKKPASADHYKWCKEGMVQPTQRVSAFGALFGRQMLLVIPAPVVLNHACPRYVPSDSRDRP